MQEDKQYGFDLRPVSVAALPWQAKGASRSKGGGSEPQHGASRGSLKHGRRGSADVELTGHAWHDMRETAFIVILLALSSSVWAQKAAPSRYWLLREEDRGVWCGYTDEATFNSAAERVKPAEAVKVTYMSGRLLDLTYQVEPESGDWLVIDKYTPTRRNAILLLRTTRLTQQRLEVIQDTTIRRGKAQPLRRVSVTTFEGKPLEDPQAQASVIDFPSVPVEARLAASVWMSVVTDMRHRSLTTLCKAEQKGAGGQEAKETDFVVGGHPLKLKYGALNGEKAEP